ncbi:hypothetical protein [Roseovarius sp. M141]|uniref:hypothetical protein n=1 Tax=Roseovarius sp. M141 TaxID=2583806 RepID=UPI0020CF237D|nr:hypothetical protein [Roseovarius sp. M141]MCQ0093935.1 hypothetical protein [Roseovarius sp. M141]
MLRCASIGAGAAAFLLDAGFAHAQSSREEIIKAAAVKSVALYDEMAACMDTAEFREVGFAPEGPCTEMTSRIFELEAYDGYLLEAGYPCVAGFFGRIYAENFDGYGGTGKAPFGTIDPEWAGKFEDCRQMLEN